MGTNDVGMLGLGWHGVESFDGMPSRWCCGYGIAFLRAPGGGTAGRGSGLTCSAVRPTDCRRRGLMAHAGGRLSRGPWPLARTRGAGDIQPRESYGWSSSSTYRSCHPELNAQSADHRTLGLPVGRDGCRAVLGEFREGPTDLRPERSAVSRGSGACLPMPVCLPRIDRLCGRWRSTRFRVGQ